MESDADPPSQSSISSSRVERIANFLRKKILENNRNKPHRFAHAAALAKSGRIISWGENSRRSVPSLAVHGKYPTMHAEVAACWGHRFTDMLFGKDVIVVRVRSNGEFAMSKPCEMCASFLKEKGVKRFFFSKNDGTFAMQEVE